MKKYLALIAALLLCAFASSAYATALPVTANPTTVTIMAGGSSKTVTVTASPANSGTLGAYSLVDDSPSWATVNTSNGTVTLEPGSSVASGDYNVVVSVTESYTVTTTTDASGHATQTQTTQTETGKATIKVTVAAALDATATPSATTTSVDTPVTITLASTGGVGTVTFTSSTQGVTVSGTTATFTPTEAGSSTLTFTATDEDSNTKEVSVTITAEAAPDVTSEDVTPTTSDDVTSEDVTPTTSDDVTSEDVTPTTSEDVTPGGETSGDVTPGGDEPGGETSGDVTPGGDEPGGDEPGGETPGGETPGGDEPGGDEPGGETPGGETPGGDEPGGDTPVVVVPPIRFTKPDDTSTTIGDTVTIQLFAEGGSGDITFSSPTQGVSVIGSTATFTPTTLGDFDLTFVATDAEGNTATVTVSVNVSARPLTLDVSASSNRTVVGREVTFMLSTTGGYGDITFGATPGVVIADHSVGSAVFTPTNEGEFPLTFSATDGADTRVTKTVPITVEAIVVSDDELEPEVEDTIEEVENEQQDEDAEIEIANMPEDLVTEIDDQAAEDMGKDADELITEENGFTPEQVALAQSTVQDTTKGVNDAKGKHVPNVPDAPKDSFFFGPRPVDREPMDQKTAKNNNEKGQGSSAPFAGFNISAGGNIPEEGAIVTGTLPIQPKETYRKSVRAQKDGMQGGNVSRGTLSSRVFAAADEMTESNKDAVIFFDSNGNITTIIPNESDDDGNPRIGGFMTMATFVEPGKEYDIILSIPTEELQDSGIAVEVTPQTITLPTFHASGTSFFSTFVSADRINGTKYYRISEDAIASKYNVVSVGEDWKRTPEELELATDNRYTMITRLATLDASEEATTHAYIVAVNFSSDKIAQLDTSELGGFVFYPKGPSNSPVAFRVLRSVESGDDGYVFEEITPEDIVNGEKSGYLTFELPAGEVFDKPMLAAYIVAASQAGEDTDDFTLDISTPSVNVKVGESTEATITPKNNSGDVSYKAYEDTTELTWITFNGNAVTFAPTLTTTAKTYNAYILGTDEEGNEASVDVTVTVLPEGSPSGSGELELRASASSLNLTVGQTETVTLTTSNLLGKAEYTFSADASVVVVRSDSKTSSEDVTITPMAAGTYPVEFTVTDSGRTTDNTASTTVTVNVKPSSDPGSSGGGCSTGFTALALAVLGGFIAARKK